MVLAYQRWYRRERASRVAGYCDASSDSKPDRLPASRLIPEAIQALPAGWISTW
jgi:hypothetical protein